jgi:hypothetical protein
MHFQHGHIAKAFTFWMEARPLFEQSSQAKRVSEINLRLAKLAQQHEASFEQLSKLSVFSSSSQQPSIDEACKVRRARAAAVIPSPPFTYAVVP